MKYFRKMVGVVKQPQWTLSLLTSRADLVKNTNASHKHMQLYILYKNVLCMFLTSVDK